MKKFILYLLLPLLLETNLFGQCPTNLPLVSQAQVDSFSLLYPTCTEIEGDLVIQGPGITNLNGLANITNITGNLIINQASSLQNVNGLSSLQSIGGSLGIIQTGLLNLNGLSSLTSINGDIGIQGNLALTDISGLENIDPSTISGSQGLYILGNPSLSICNLDNFCTYLSFPAVTHPRTISTNGANCGSVAVITASCSTDCPSGDLVFSTQSEINSFALAYPSCTHIFGNVIIEGGSNITNLNALANLTNISGNLTIQNNTTLTNINGLISLISIGGNVTISQNSALENVNGLNFVTSIGGSLTVSNNSQLTSILGLQNVDPGSISGLQIQNNPALAVCNLPNLCTYLLNPSSTHPRTITGNAAACINETAMMGSCSLTCPVGDIVFLNQAQIDNFIMAYPECTEISGSLTIQGNGISNLNGLANITSISGNLVINQASNLLNLDGLSALESVGGSMGIAQSGIQHLNGLSSLTTIGGALVLQANPQLNDITGLENIDPSSITGVGLTIVNNPQVSFCNLPNLCTYLANPATTHPRTILGNTGDCQTIVEVLTQCTPVEPEPECEVPNNISGSISSTTSITLTWTSSGTLFDIEYVTQGTSPTGIPSFENIGKPFILENLNPETSYKVYIRQVCENNIKSEWSSAYSFSTPTIVEEPEEVEGTQSFRFTTQEEVDEFITENPTLTVITGNIIIRGGHDITNLNGLSNITKINGDLIIGSFDNYNTEGQLVNNGNYNLSSLTGLHSLTEVGGNLIIQNNPVLENLSGLNALTSIGGNLTIGEHKRYNALHNKILSGGNPMLENLNGLTALSSIGGSLTIVDNDVLGDINGLSSLTTIGTTSGTGNIYIAGNAQLINLNGLSALTEVKGNLSIGSEDKYYSKNNSYELYFLDEGENAQLQHISGLTNIIEVGGNIYIKNNPQLQNLDGLSSITTVGESLIIQQNPLIQNLNGLNSITQVGGSLNVIGNSQLQSLNGLSSVTTIGEESLYINNNDALQNLSGLGSISSLKTLIISGNDNLQSLSGLSSSVNSLNHLAIEGNNALQTLAGLSGVTDISNGVIYIRNNPQLQNLGLTAITSNTIGTLEISGNNSLQNLDGLSSAIHNIDYMYIHDNLNLEVANLGSIDNIWDISIKGNQNLEEINLQGTATMGRLNISENPSLLNLNGFSTSITNLKQLIIKGNQNLEDITALSNLTMIEGWCYIGYNPSLESLEGLDSITAITGSLTIENNDSLSNLDELSNLTTLSGHILIRQNAQLTDISGLQNIDPSGILPISDYSYSMLKYTDAYKGGLIIVHNPDLMVCNLPNFCTYLSNPENTHPRSIWGNAGSCINAGPCLTPPVACPTGDYVFSSQADVVGFELLYGDCTDIVLNNVVIGNIDTDLYSPISDISFLENVVGITGNLTIKKTSNLSNLTGLNQLNGIGGNFEFSNNNATENLNGLSGFSFIGGNIIIDSNMALQNLFGTNLLTAINGKLEIKHNSSLLNLNGLNAVTSVDGDIEVGYNSLLQNLNLSDLEESKSITIHNNNQLQNIGLNNLTTVDGDFNILSNNNLQHLNTLNSLTTITNDLSIRNNNSLQNLDGLSSLSNILGTLSIYNNSSLSNASGLENINYETLSYLSITDNSSLPMCSFPNICTFIIVKPGKSIIFGNHSECASLENVTNNCFAGNCDSFTIWRNNQWSNREPNLQTKAILMDEFTVSENIEACELEVYQAGSIIIEDENILTVEGQIINRAGTEDFVIKNKGSLIQTDNVANIGEIIVQKNSNPMFRLDYTLWSSPVAGQNLQAFSPETLPTRIYKYDAVNDAYDNAYPETTFLAGQGYLFRAPNNWIINDGVNSAQPYAGAFTGVAHNGEVSVNVVSGAYNGLGNPYPSAIDAEELFDANPSIQTIYFWTNTNTPVDGVYVANNWASWTTTGGTSADGSIIEPNGEIAVGQGFIAHVNGTTSVTFNNDMRIGGAGMFFKPFQTERHRLWLNLNSNELTLNQILIGYVPGATQGVDNQIDGEMFGYGESALYSRIENTEKQFVIQGRSLPFEASDVVPLGFRATTAGEFTISLANFDGLFAEGQNIYLKDNVAQVLHDLKESAYSFISEEGIFDTRFEVVYQTTMSVEAPDLNNNWIVFKQGDQFQILTQGFDMKSVQVFDMLGRTVYTAPAEGTTHTIARIDATQVLIVKVTTADGEVLTKKVQN